MMYVYALDIDIYHNTCYVLSITLDKVLYLLIYIFYI